MQDVFRFRRRTIESQVQTAFPALDHGDVKKVVGGFYEHLGLLTLEMIRLPRLSPEKLLQRCEFHGFEHVDQALRKGCGVLALSAHFGNWELGLAACARRGYPTHVIVKEIKGATANYGVQRLRAAHHVGVFPRRSSIRQILQALRRNEPVGFVLDQNTTSDEGVFVKFFGRPACTMPGLAVLAKRTGSPVIPLAFYRDADRRRHHIVAYPEVPLTSVDGNSDMEIRLNTQRFTHVLEELIRKHPEQWMWMHRRWRTQPESPGEMAAIDQAEAACAMNGAPQ